MPAYEQVDQLGNYRARVARVATCAPRCPRVPVDDTDNDDRFDTLCSIFPRLLPGFHVVPTEVERSHAERVEAKGKADRERSVQIGEGFRRNGGGNVFLSLDRLARDPFPFAFLTTLNHASGKINTRPRSRS